MMMFQEPAGRHCADGGCYGGLGGGGGAGGGQGRRAGHQGLLGHHRPHVGCCQVTSAPHDDVTLVLNNP